MNLNRLQEHSRDQHSLVYTTDGMTLRHICGQSKRHLEQNVPIDLGPLDAFYREKDFSFSVRKDFEIKARQKLDSLIHQFSIYQ